MIRFYCNHCGKSLRAEETIVGRKSKCTSCGEVNKVPRKSTRTSGEKKKPDQEILAVLANSDSFSQFEDIEMAIGSLSKERVKSTSANEPLIAAPPIPMAKSLLDHDAVELFEPVFKTVRPKRHILPIFLMAVASLAVLIALAYFLTSSGDQRAQPAVKSAFEQTPHATLYGMTIADLKKSKRVLEIACEGYLNAKGRPSSDLSRLDNLKQQIDSFANDGYAMKEGNSRFDAGDSKGARELIMIETKRVKKLIAEVKAETEKIQAQTYAHSN